MQPCGLPSFHKVRRRIIDVVMLALAGTAFRSEYAATVDILEIPIGKLIVLTPKYHMPYSAKPWRRMYSLSSMADGWCSLHASRSSNTNRASSINSLARSHARWLSVTVMNGLLFQSLRIRG
jgi:hypothetical protein